MAVVSFHIEANFVHEYFQEFWTRLCILIHHVHVMQFLYITEF
jgi:hypothetical protein